jgi:TonB family protein
MKPGSSAPREKKPRGEGAAEAPGGLRLSHVAVISLELHAAVVMLVLGSGALESKAPPRERRVDIVSIKDLTPPAAPLPPLAAPKAAPPGDTAPSPDAPENESPKEPVDPTLLNEKLEEADGSFTGMAVAASGAHSSVGKAPQGKVGGGGSGDDFGDFVPQYTINVLPVVPDDEARSRIRYPALAAKQGIEATVYLELFIDGAGRIVHINVLKDPGFGFAEAAAQALLGMKCAPAEMDGRPVAVRYRYPVNFRLR